MEIVDAKIYNVFMVSRTIIKTYSLVFRRFYKFSCVEQLLSRLMKEDLFRLVVW